MAVKRRVRRRRRAGGTMRAALASIAAGHLQQAATELEGVLARAPDHPDALHALGAIAQSQGQSLGAIELIEAAIARRSAVAEYHANLGVALRAAGQLERAVAALRRAIALDPSAAAAHYNLGAALGERPDAAGEALRHLREAVRLQPAYPKAQALLCLALRRICAWEEAAAHLEPLIDHTRRQLGARDQTDLEPFVALALPLPVDLQIQVAQSWGRALWRRHQAARAAIGTRGPAQNGTGRVRIGYLSPDLWDHAVGFLTRGLFERHDRRRFEIIAYSLRDVHDPCRRRIERGVDRFVDLSEAPALEAARRIQSDGVQVLVDLSGYTTASRPDILACQPAPVQCHLIGYPFTLGAPFVQYRLTDPIMHPPALAGCFDETLAWVPAHGFEGFQDQVPEACPSRAELGLPEGALVLCCMAQGYRIDRRVFAAWMRILAQVPQAVLWLRGSGDLRRSLRERAGGQGVDPRRLIFAGSERMSDRWLHRQADLWLDTWRLSSGTGAILAAWAGLPVLCLAGESPQSRTSAAIMSAAGVPELVAPSEAAYEAQAVRLANDPKARGRLRDRLIRGRAESPLFDQAGFVRHLEDAYLEMIAAAEERR